MNYVWYENSARNCTAWGKMVLPQQLAGLQIVYSLHSISAAFTANLFPIKE